MTNQIFIAMNNERIIKKRDVKLMQALQIYSGVFPTDMVHFRLNLEGIKENNRFVLTPVIQTVIKLIRIANNKFKKSEPMLLLIMIDVKADKEKQIEINLFLFGTGTMDYVPFLSGLFNDLCVKANADGEIYGVLLQTKDEIWEVFSASEPFDHTIPNLARDMKIITPYRALILGEDFLKIHFNFHINHGFKG